MGVFYLYKFNLIFLNIGIFLCCCFILFKFKFIVKIFVDLFNFLIKFLFGFIIIEWLVYFVLLLNLVLLVLMINILFLIVCVFSNEC